MDSYVGGTRDVAKTKTDVASGEGGPMFGVKRRCWKYRCTFEKYEGEKTVDAEMRENQKEKPSCDDAGSQ